MNSDDQVRQAQENFKIITNIKEKLEILKEHVDSRKESLEEEIEENLHESIRNARDCLEKIQENIEPKLEGIIRERLDILKVKMDRFTKEGLDALHKEIDKQTPILTQKILQEVDGLVASKLMVAHNELSISIDQKTQAEVKKVVSNDKIEMEKKYAKLWKVCIVSLGFSLTAFGVLLLGNL
jgi:hypothetical protein